MEENQLKILEERINNAISFIENLKSREKALLEEKEDLAHRNKELEEAVREKEQRIESLQENQLFLKNKIEAVLDKLEAFAGMEGYSSSLHEETEPERISPVPTDESEAAAVGSTEEDSGGGLPQEGEKQRDDSGEIVIEENLVDLKSETPGRNPIEVESDAIDENPAPENNGENETTDGITQSQSEKDLFTEGEEENEQKESDNEDQGKRAFEYDDPFLDT